jgi:hypothetical protein
MLSAVLHGCGRMASDAPDPFVDFAARHQLCVGNQDLIGAPRDVLAPPPDLERHVLVTLSAVRADVSPVRLLFTTEASDPRPVSARDALWWLAGDCWAVERVARDYGRWAETYRYPDDDPATLRLFQLHVAQADALQALMGTEVYSELLELHHQQIGADRMSPVRRRRLTD